MRQYERLRQLGEQKQRERAAALRAEGKGVDVRLIPVGFTGGNTKAVEIWDTAGLVGVIYPTELGVQIVSKHIDAASPDLVAVVPVSPPAVLVNILKV